MLVIGRKPGQYVMIGDEIMVKVVRSTKGDLRLAIKAPAHVRVVRGEVYEVELVKSPKEGPRR
jgi:carbon storage regulator